MSKSRRFVLVCEGNSETGKQLTPACPITASHHPKAWSDRSPRQRECNQPKGCRTFAVVFIVTCVVFVLYVCSLPQNGDFYFIIIFIKFYSSLRNSLAMWMSKYTASADPMTPFQ